ncbi:MAG: methyltransferase [Dehalococcoidales bacterium]
MSVWTMGNSAKLYCLNWIEQFVLQKAGEVKILDLGCGTALNFVNLLKAYPRIQYVGIEPSKASCLRAQQNLSSLNARVINSYAYEMYEQLKEKFDIIVSFSVLEHVYRRMDYLRSAHDCLKDDGYFLVNYDAAHIFSWGERLSKSIGLLLAFFGIEKYYVSLVKDKDFLEMIEKLGFRIIDSKFFSTGLKRTFKLIPESYRTEYMKRWLEFELWLNELGIDYNDSKASSLRTRNFILARK